MKRKEKEMTNKVSELEETMIGKSIEILSKQKISQTEEKIVRDTVRLIEFTQGFNCQQHPIGHI